MNKMELEKEDLLTSLKQQKTKSEYTASNSRYAVLSDLVGKGILSQNIEDAIKSNCNKRTPNCFCTAVIEKLENKGRIHNDEAKKLLNIIISVQSVVCIFAIYYGVIFLSFGSTTFEYRDLVMKNNASGYELYKWSNSKLNENDVLITTHRSNALSNVKTIPGNFLYYIRPDNKNAKKYFEEIKKALANLKLNKLPEIICEPGRAIVAESGSTIVRVNLRKKQKLYINDGTYGTLFDAGIPNIVYPSRLITNGRIVSKKLTSFDFYGPTCDSMDYMKGPFILPNNIKENDYIELGQLGAYGLTFRTDFNGLYSNNIFEVEDNPIMTMYDKEAKNQFLVA